MNSIYQTDIVPSTKYQGWTIKVERHYDHAAAAAPWDNDCGCVTVTQRRIDRFSRDFRYATGKAAGEIILHEGRGTIWVVDFAAEVKRARKEGWGISPEHSREVRKLMAYRAMSPGMRNMVRDADLQARADCISLTKGQTAVAAVRQSMKHCERWLRDQWHYLGLVVSVESAPEGVAFDPDAADSLWGIESDSESYVVETARVMGDALIEQALKAHAEAEAAEAVRRVEVARAKVSIKPVTVQQLGVYLEVPDDATVRADGWVSAWVFALKGGAA